MQQRRGSLVLSERKAQLGGRKGETQCLSNQYEHGSNSEKRTRGKF